MINDPITVSSGVTYDRAQLSRYFGNKNQVDCPITKQRIDREELKFKTSVFLNGLIEAFVTEQENMFKSRSALIEEETSAEARFVP